MRFCCLVMLAACRRAEHSLMANARRGLFLPQIKVQKSALQRPSSQKPIAETFSSFKKQSHCQPGFSHCLEHISSTSVGLAQASIALPAVRSKGAEQAGMHKQLCRQPTQVSKHRILPPAPLPLRLKAVEQSSGTFSTSLQPKEFGCAIKQPQVMSYKFSSAGTQPLEGLCLCTKHEDAQDMAFAKIVQAAEEQLSDREFCCSDSHLFTALSSSTRSTPMRDLTEHEQSGEVYKGSGLDHYAVPASPHLLPNQDVVDEAVEWASKLADQKASQAKLLKEYSMQQSSKVRQV